VEDEYVGRVHHRERAHHLLYHQEGPHRRLPCDVHIALVEHHKIDAPSSSDYLYEEHEVVGEQKGDERAVVTAGNARVQEPAVVVHTRSTPAAMIAVVSPLAAIISILASYNGTEWAQLF